MVPGHVMGNYLHLNAFGYSIEQDGLRKQNQNNMAVHPDAYSKEDHEYRAHLLLMLKQYNCVNINNVLIF